MDKSYLGAARRGCWCRRRPCWDWGWSEGGRPWQGTEGCWRPSSEAWGSLACSACEKWLSHPDWESPSHWEGPPELHSAGVTPPSSRQKLYYSDTLIEQNHTGEIASRLLVLGARPFGMTPGGGWRALFITLLQLATMVRIVSDSSCDTFLTKHKKGQTIYHTHPGQILLHITKHLSITSLYCSHCTTITVCWFVNTVVCAQGSRTKFFTWENPKLSNPNLWKNTS